MSLFTFHLQPQLYNRAAATCSIAKASATLYVLHSIRAHLTAWLKLRQLRVISCPRTRTTTSHATEPLKRRTFTFAMGSSENEVKSASPLVERDFCAQLSQ